MNKKHLIKYFAYLRNIQPIIPMFTVKKEDKDNTALYKRLFAFVNAR